MANPKLRNVPMRMYSVSLRSLALVRSPNRKIDLAAIKNPMAAHWLFYHQFSLYIHKLIDMQLLSTY